MNPLEQTPSLTAIRNKEGNGSEGMSGSLINTGMYPLPLQTKDVRARMISLHITQAGMYRNPRQKVELYKCLRENDGW